VVASRNYHRAPQEQLEVSSTSVLSTVVRYPDHEDHSPRDTRASLLLILAEAWM